MTLEEAATVSVVIPTFNRRTNLDRVLAPLLDDPATLDVVVVDDGGTDGTYDALVERARTDHRIRPIRVENAGQASARQVGCEHARGDVVLMLDDDVVAHRGLVTDHARHHRGDRDLVVLGYMPTVRPARRRPGDFATFLYADAYERRCRTYDEDADNVLRYLWGGNVSMRRTDALRVGVHDPRYPKLYHQDREFGIRCRAAGLRGVFDRSLRADHIHHRPLDAFVRDARSQGAGRLRIAALHPDAANDAYATGSTVATAIADRAATRRFHAAVTAALRAVVVAGGQARLWAVEELGARALRRVEQAYGRRAAAADTRGEPVAAAQVAR